ncbi:MAG: ATP-binding protein [Nakamurella sp.]
MGDCRVDETEYPVGSSPGRSVLELPANAGAPALARAHVRHCAARLPADVTDDALLLTSELVSNAVEHGAPRIVLHVQTGASDIVVRVHDDGRGLPAPPTRSPNGSDPSGRGLRIVAAIATKWGIDLAKDGKSGKDVWFALNVQPDT